MYDSKNPYCILGILSSATKDEIKKAYKEIALTCHPDKLVNITDENEKQRRINKFKEASMAYDILVNKGGHDVTWDNITYDSSDNDFDWKDVWSQFFNKEVIKETLYDIANHFVKNRIYPKAYYNPSTTSNMQNKKSHDIKLEVSYHEILTNAKKKLRLILVDIDEPVFLDVYCGSFPQVVKEYAYDAEDGEEILHDIIINMEIKKQDNLDHIISKNGSIDIITSLDINLYEYVTGSLKNVKYIDGQNMQIYIPPFQKDFYEICGKGVKNGSFIINLNVQYIQKVKWDALNEKDKAEMIRLLNVCV
jgi:DnaJ-class molecular chaperone